MIRDRVKELRRVRAEITPDMEVPVLIVDLDDDEATLVLATHDPLGVMAHLESVSLPELGLQRLRPSRVMEDPGMSRGALGDRHPDPRR
ncbi:MAG TPA: hypothetical protein VM223_10875 [Planctomycetota bacterium]|nr:hypothetical protein [Planctomycetota bacterium]